ncbi:glycoside hydrolase family 97 N-terminal domain-containing protein [Streptomyces cinereospinus]|uniref:glycoside hydrolase family 97 N-terminal domain-containing protein n=1 Tax=Streptomyces cinereospinus TaxID=285561 RepID=UPI00361CE43B
MTAALAAARAAGLPAVAPRALGGDSVTWTVAAYGPAAQADLAAEVTLDDETGALSLSVQNGGATVLEPSPLGIVADEADLTSGLRLLERTDATVSESCTAVAGKQRERTVSTEESRFSFEGANGVRRDLVLRVCDDGVAYRYVLPEADPDGDGVAVREEASAFNLPGDSAAWLKGYSNSYERSQDPVTTVTAAASGEFARPSPFQTDQDDFVLLTESDVDGRCAASRLVHETGSNQYQVELAADEILEGRRLDAAADRLRRNPRRGDLAVGQLERRQHRRSGTSSSGGDRWFIGSVVSGDATTP